METATIIARPRFDDIQEDDLPDGSLQRGSAPPDAAEVGAGEQLPEPPAPFEDRAPTSGAAAPSTVEGRPFAKVYGALEAGSPREDGGDEAKRTVRLGRRDSLTSKAGGREGAPWEHAADKQDLVEKQAALRERFSGPDLDMEEEPPATGAGARRGDPARLSGGRRSRIHTKRHGVNPEDDAILSEMARQYSREYTGREGWSAGAILDSVSYAIRIVGRAAGRTIAVRRLRKERERRERIRADQLSELGEVALSLRDLDTPLLEDYRSRLLELHRDQEMREDELDSLNQQIEQSRRDFSQAERLAQTEAEELESATKATGEQLRPVEVSYRSALKAARSAEEDARALARQIDHARGELSRMSGPEVGGDEAARMKARMERWTSEREGLLREVPRLEEKAAALEPEIERLRKEVERCKVAERDHREQILQREADHKREVQRLEGEMERIRVVIENIAGSRRALFAECGRQLDIDRPLHEHLEEIYGELDATAAEIRRLESEIEIAHGKPEPPDSGALIRAAVAFCGVVILLSLIFWAVS